MDFAMKSKSPDKIRKEDLPKDPKWLEQAREDFKRGPLGKLSDEEIGQLCEELAERGARKQQTQTAS